MYSLSFLEHQFIFLVNKEYHHYLLRALPETVHTLSYLNPIHPVHPFEGGSSHTMQRKKPQFKCQNATPTLGGLP